MNSDRERQNVNYEVRDDTLSNVKNSTMDRVCRTHVSAPNPNEIQKYYRISENLERKMRDRSISIDQKHADLSGID